MPSIYTQSAEERQRAYEAVGLRSWEIAKWEAEVSGQKKKEAMSELERTVGAPERVGIQGQLREFTLPSGVRRTFTEAGDQTSLQLPLNLTNDYAPQDRKKIEKLYQARSKFATDPELTPQERQLGMDKVDAQISRVPHISPMMKEPTAQQKFDASKIKLPNGEMGYVDKAGNPKAFEWSKQAQEREKDKTAALWKEYNAVMGAAEKKGEKLDPDVAYRRAKNTVALLSGEMPEITDTVGHEMTTVWRDEVDDASWFKASNTNMLKARSNFITRMTTDYGYSAEQAGHSFMMLWSEAARNPDDEFHKWVPAFGEKEQRELRQVVTGRMQEGDPRLSKGRGTGTVTVDGKTFSTEDIQMRVGEGKVTVDGRTMRIFKGMVIMTKDGEEFGLRPNEVEEALKLGYKLAE